MSEVLEIYADRISDPENPMRSDIERETLFDLADSIKKEGLINPITVRPKGDGYEVVAGHRRFAACKIAGIVKIACVVKELNDEQAFSLMAHENLFRKDVDPVDEALFIGRLIHNMDMTIEKVAEKLNRSVQWVADRYEILTYPDYMVVVLKDGRLKLGVAKWLGQIEDDTYRKMFVDNAVNHGMSVRQAEYLFRQYELGLLTPSEKIMPSDIELPAGEPAKVKAICARCGQMAVDPNLRNVFIHKECPQNE